MTTEVPSPGDGEHGGGTVGTPRGASPLAPARAVPRPRLVTRLDQIERAAIVRAVTGYGKTVAVAQWADSHRAAGHPTAWTGRPWQHTDGWAVVRDALTAELRAAGADVPDAAAPGALAAAVASVGRPVVLVVDDADELDDPDAVKAVAELVSRAPALRTVLVTAARYPLLATGAQHPVLAAVEGPVPTLTLTARDLAFTAGELAAAAEAWGHPVDDTALAELVVLVGGWVRLARAVLDDTRPDDLRLATAAADAFTREVVLPSIGDHPVLDTAMVVAGAGGLCPPTGNIALEAAGMRMPVGDAADLLLRLEAVGALVRTRDHGGTSSWRVPVVLRDALRQRLERKLPELSMRVHRALARAALDQQPSDPRGATLHAGRARDWELLETCWLDHGPFLMALGGPEVDAVFAGVPDEAADTSTVLAVARATARRGHDDTVDVRDTVLRLMAELGALALRGEWRCRTDAGRWFAATAAVVAARSHGDLPRAIAVAAEAVATTPDVSGRTGASGRPYGWFLVQSSRSALLEGDLTTSLATATRAFELSTPSQAPDVRAAAAAHIALLHAQSGTLRDADRWIVRYVEALDPDWEDVMRDDAADVAEALLGLQQLDLPSAEAAMRRLEEGAREPDVAWPLALRAQVRHAVLTADPETGLAQLEEVERNHRVWMEQPGLARSTVRRMRAELLLALGEVHRAEELLTRVEPGAAWTDVPRARWHLQTGDPHAARRVVEKGTRRLGVGMGDRTALLVLGAWAAHVAGEAGLAERSFRSARRLADPQMALFPFALMPATVRDHLAEQIGAPFDEESQWRLERIGDVLPEPASLVALTPRERTVLALLADHGTAREVAEELGISVNTVRKQVLSIYAKLGVHDRDAALRRAQQLGLVTASPSR